MTLPDKRVVCGNDCPGAITALPSAGKPGYRIPGKSTNFFGVDQNEYRRHQLWVRDGKAKCNAAVSFRAQRSHGTNDEHCPQVSCWIGDDSLWWRARSTGRLALSRR